ncbi:MAG: PAS domain S-box protein [Bacteroidota bacterium]
MEIPRVSNLAQLAFDNLSTPSCCLNVEGKILLSNQAMNRQLGRDRIGIKQESIFRFFVDLSPNQWNKIWKRMLSEGSVQWLGMIQPQGISTPNPVEIEIQLMPNENSEESLALIQTREFSSEVLLGDWRLTEESGLALDMNASNLFQEVFDHSPLGILLFSPKGEIVLANISICQMLQCPEQRLYEMHGSDLIYKTDKKRYRKQLLRHLSGISQYSETRLRFLQQGEGLFWGKVTQKSVSNEVGEVQYLIMMVEDISDEVAVATQRQLEYQKQRFIFDALPIIFYHKDANNNIINCNVLAAQSMGMNVKELIGCNALHIHPQQAEQYLADDLSVIESGEPKLGVIEQYHTPGGSYWVKVDRVPYYEPDGTISGVLIFASDISELKQTEEELTTKNLMLQRYIESNSQLENFAFIASHDLKEPLRTISNFSSLLARRYAERLDQDGKDFIGFITHGAQKLNRMINDLLRYSRVNNMEHIEEIIYDQLTQALGSCEEVD